jgi:hypothetical protein
MYAGNQLETSNCNQRHNKLCNSLGNAGAIVRVAQCLAPPRYAVLGMRFDRSELGLRQQQHPVVI